MITADVGVPIRLAAAHETRAELVFEDGAHLHLALKIDGSGQITLPAIATPGYHELHIGDRTVKLAIAPRTVETIQGRAAGRPLWGLAVQLYGLRRPGDDGMGDATALRILVKQAAQHGADAIALSPVHALFGAEPNKFSPYSPSSRLALNPLVCDPAIVFGDERIATLRGTSGIAHGNDTDSLIDWPKAAARKLATLRALFDTFWIDLKDHPDDTRCRDFLKFQQEAGTDVESHALFEALSAERKRIDPLHSGWRDWPAALRNPAGAAVAAFAADHTEDVAFHIFLQWLAQRSLAAAQADAIQAGMRIGLIADLAIGMESSGSHAWARQNDLLIGLNVGAPPDLFNPKGQNWELTTFSPRALSAYAFAPFIETLRAVLGQSGGIRIDHVMGLSRLWLIPEGAEASEGAYLAYPLHDLLRLVKLESARHCAVVIAEDLGTVPAGFRDKIADAGIAGMDVLWFMRDGKGFLPPRKWRADAVAMTSTHDLPTIAGWWRGTDLGVRAEFDFLEPGQTFESAKEQRAEDRAALWHAFQTEVTVPENSPMPEDAGTAVDASLAFVAATPAPLVLAPLEDLLAIEEQPNLPGTIDQHPNWRRRYAASVEDIFSDSKVTERAKVLSRRGTQ
jgi:4-alpha-glucanotransferase